MTSQNNPIACLKVPQVDGNGKRTIRLVPLNALETYGAYVKEGLIPKPTIGDLANNNWFQGALGMHKMNARLAALDGIRPKKAYGQFGKMEGISDFFTDLGKKVVEGLKNTITTQGSNIMSQAANKLSPELEKLKAQTSEAAKDAGTKGVEKLKFELQNYLNGRDVNLGNIHPAFGKLAKAFVKNKAIKKLAKNQAIAEIAEYGESNSSNLGQLGFLDSMPKWVYWAGGALGVGVLAWFLIKQLSGGSGFKFKGLSGLGQLGDSVLGGGYERRVRQLLGGSNNYEFSNDPIASMIKTHEMAEYSPANLGRLNALGEIQAAFDMNNIYEPLNNDEIDEMPLSTREFAAFQVANRLPRYRNFKQKLLHNRALHGGFDLPGYDNTIAAIYSGYSNLGDVGNNIYVGELGSLFSKVFKGVKNVLKKTNPLYLAAKGITSAVGRNLKKQSKATLKRAKKIDKLLSQLKKLGYVQKMSKSEAEKYSQQLKNARTAADKAGYQRGFNSMKSAYDKSQNEITRLKNQIASEKNRYNQEVANLKSTASQAKREYKKVRSLERTRIRGAQRIREGLATTNPDRPVTTADGTVISPDINARTSFRGRGTPNLIYLTTREYSEHLKKIQGAEALVAKVKTQISALLAEKKKMTTKLGNANTKIMQLKNKLANLTKKYASGVVSDKIKAGIEKERKELLQKMSSLKSIMTEQMTKMKDLSDHAIKAAGEQINQTGINMMFDFFEKLTGAMRDVKDISQVSEFLKFFPELMDTFKTTVETVVPDAPTVENVISIPEPTITFEPSKPTPVIVSPRFEFEPVPAEVENRINMQTNVNPQDINVPISVTPQGLKVVPVPVQIQQESSNKGQRRVRQPRQQAVVV